MRTSETVQLAEQRSKDRLGGTKFRSLTAIAAAASGISLWFVVGDSASERMIAGTFGTVGAPLAIALAVFGYEFVRAPYLQRDEARAELALRQDTERSIQRLNDQLLKGNALLDQVWAWREAESVTPGYYLNYCLPEIIEWNRQTAELVGREAPSYLGKFQNDGDLHTDTGAKSAAIQQLEGRLQRLDTIIDDLRLN